MENAWLIKVKDTETGATQSKETASDTNKPAEKSTPGFEIFGAMLSVVILFLIKRKNA